ncbi:hypothetical protein Glove_426g11 [Diversispora epigaea]|uniref:Uncharacterized protein n=1 Tax=Diversispora epigaea TaxID=1348612 RepID=A0A397GVD5_9GLOM|nr:hypothetical protein Glove_426g11 [Diversispora epigaea]
MSSNTILQQDYSSSHPLTASSKMLTDDYYKWYAELDDLPTPLTDKIRLILYRAYTEETGLDPWIMSETPEPPQIEKTDNYLLQDCVIKISKFLKKKSIILDAVHKRFPFLSYTNSNAWHRDIFKYTNSEAKCPICKEVHTRLGIWGDWSCLGTNDHYFLNCPFRIDQKKVIIAIQSLPEMSNKTQSPIPSTNPNKIYQPEAERNRWAMGCFPTDLERDIRFYRGGIKRNEDIRKYHKFLTDRDRLIDEELLHRSILKSGLSVCGDVCGGVRGNIRGDACGGAYGDLCGGVRGDLRNDACGDIRGDVRGDACGDIRGDAHNGDDICEKM